MEQTQSHAGKVRFEIVQEKQRLSISGKLIRKAYKAVALPLSYAGVRLILAELLAVSQDARIHGCGRIAAGA